MVKSADECLEGAITCMRLVIYSPNLAIYGEFPALATIRNVITKSPQQICGRLGGDALFRSPYCLSWVCLP